MYRMARKLVVPDCVRIQPSTWFRSSDTKNIRSASLRCEIENIARRGFPASVCSICWMSRDSPSIQLEKLGEASKLFNDIARSKRSLAGKNESKSITPILVIGGV